MNFPAELIPPALKWPLALSYLGLLALAARHAPWRALTIATQRNVWIGATLTMLALWQVKAGIRPGLDLHLLGASALTLISGPALALLGLSLALLASTLIDGAGLTNFAFAGWLLVALPIGLTYTIVMVCHRYLPQHIFIYLFVAVFLATALSTALTALAISGVLAASGVYPVSHLRHEYLPYFLLLSWPEALLTGMALTLMVVFRPNWVATYYEEPLRR